MCLAAGHPVPEKTKVPHPQGSADPAQRSPERPAAHFQADPLIEGSLTWSAVIENAFTQGNLTLKNNQLHVGHKGLYFIYSQATFGGNQCPEDKKNLVSLSVILESKELGDKVHLLRADRTPCEQPHVLPANNGNRAGWNKSIFQGGAFKLGKGDILYVVTTGTTYLKRENGATYFGAYAL